VVLAGLDSDSKEDEILDAVEGVNEAMILLIQQLSQLYVVERLTDFQYSNQLDSSFYFFCIKLRINDIGDYLFLLHQ
jgi:hypothetical protein